MESLFFEYFTVVIDSTYGDIITQKLLHLAEESQMLDAFLKVLFPQLRMSALHAFSEHNSDILNLSLQRLVLLLSSDASCCALLRIMPFFKESDPLRACTTDFLLPFFSFHPADIFQLRSMVTTVVTSPATLNELHTHVSALVDMHSATVRLLCSLMKRLLCCAGTKNRVREWLTAVVLHEAELEKSRPNFMNCLGLGFPRLFTPSRGGFESGGSVGRAGAADLPEAAAARAGVPDVG